MGARNPANQMTVEELIRNGLIVSKKFPISDEAKNERGLLFGMVKQRYGNNNAIRAAALLATVQYFVPAGSGDRGTYALVEGPLERLDFNSDSLTVDGVRIKFSNIYDITIDGIDPDDVDDDEDWEVRWARMTPGERRQYERQMQALQEQMRRDWERQQEQMRRQMERDMMRQKEQARQRAYEERWTHRNYGGDDDEESDDSGWTPDYDPEVATAMRREMREQGRQNRSCKKKEPKTILWLPPSKRGGGGSGRNRHGKTPAA